MTRLGTYAAIVFGALFGAGWGFLFPAPFSPPGSIIIGALIGSIMCGAISYSWEIK